MHSLTIIQKNHPQPTIIGLCDLLLEPDPSVALYFTLFRGLHGPAYPFVENPASIGTLACRLEI